MIRRNGEGGKKEVSIIEKEAGRTIQRVGKMKWIYLWCKSKSNVIQSCQIHPFSV